MKFTHALLIAIFIVLGLIAAKMYMNKGFESAVYTNPTADMISTTPVQDESMMFAPPTTFPTSTLKQTGTIEGSLSYPSEGIPNDMQVCAENITTYESFCTSEKIADAKYTYGKGYMLKAPPGNYYIYAKLPNQEYKAYYNAFVACGLLASCKDHTPIAVSVSANTTTSKIDPQDWYGTQP